MRYENITIRGNKTSLLWICGWLMERSVDFQFESMGEFLSFVQVCYEDSPSVIQGIIENCPYKGWDIASQYDVKSPSVLY